MAKKYLSLDRLTEYDELIKGVVSDGDNATLASAKSYADGLANGKADKTHNHDDVYYTETEIDTKLSEVNTSITNITSGTIVVKKAEEANHATNADTATNATNANHAASADSATNATNATKATQDASGNVITTTYETKADASAKLAEAKGYADTAATTAANKVKDDLLNGAGEAYDTLKELGDLITENKDAIDVLEDVATNKANKEHEHTVADITDYVAPVQADWNQNDPEALDYVKNRPFYSGNSIETVMLEGTVITNDGYFGSGIFVGEFDDIGLELGKTYMVSFNGTRYECVAYESNNMYFIGNSTLCPMIDGVTSDTDKPFIICPDFGLIFTDMAGTYDIILSSELSEVVKIDKKYLPDSVGALTEAGGEYEYLHPSDGEYHTVELHGGGEIFNDYSNNVAEEWAHAEGHETAAIGSCSHAEGKLTCAVGDSSHTEGQITYAIGDYSHAEGHYTYAIGESSHAEGYNTKANGYYSHAEGGWTKAEADYSHAEGCGAEANGEYGSHAEGYYTKANGESSHAEGYSTEANANYSHAEGYYTKASSEYQHVQGKNNVEDTEDKYAHIVGNGTDETPSNAHTLDWEGNAWFAGDVYVGGTSQDDASKLMTETDVDAKIENITTGGITVSNATNAEKAEKDANGNVITSTYETKEDAQAKLDEAKAYTNTMTSGMATTTVVDNKISAHNTSSTAHTDIRDLITALSTKVNNFLDVSDTTTDQLSEVLTLINNNKGTLDSITSNKVNVSDIVDNLTTANASKVLSANQGVVLKGLIDALQEAVDGKSDEGHKHAISDVTDLQTTLNAKASQTDLDAVEVKANNANTSITNIVNGTTTVAKASSADSAANAEKLGGQLPSYYAKASDIPTGALADKDIVSESDLDSTLAEKVNAAAEGNHSHSNKGVLDGITSAKVSAWDNAEANAKAYADEKVANLLDNSTEAVDSIMELAEAMENNADAISALETVAASKVPTSRKVNGKALTADITLSADDVNADAKGSAGAVQTNLDTHTSNTTVHITSAERTNWNAAKTHADSAHAPSNAQANVIESIKVNGTAQTITSKSVNITVPTDNASLTNGAGYITASAIANKADKATTLSGYGITDAYTKSEVDAKTAVDSALSSTSTKPVQNKVVNDVVVTLTSTIGTNTSSISALTDRTKSLEDKVGDGFEEITSTEIQNLFK